MNEFVKKIQNSRKFFIQSRTVYLKLADIVKL